MRYFIIALVLLGFGCSQQEAVTPLADEEAATVQEESLVVLPLGSSSFYLPIYKRFGEYFEDRFHGYHTGEDAEITPEDLSPDEIQIEQVQAVADGQVVFMDNVDGYGGVIVLQHELEGEAFQTLYGHVDIDSTTLAVGETVTRGQFLVNLGQEKSEDTDGERQHLHFAVYPGHQMEFAGYVSDPSQLNAWINPYDFFLKYGAIQPESINYGDEGIISSYDLYYPEPPRRDIPVFRTHWGEIAFSLPYDWDVEYISSLDALNLYKVSGSGTARERSQILIRYFDASEFLTLSTVTVYSTQDLVVGTENYAARRYDIEKNAGVPDFVDQPSWRNKRHLVTDFRAQDGRTRYYVVAKNPELDLGVYESILSSFEIIE